MNIKLHIYTFPKGTSHGSCIPVADIVTDLQLSYEQITVGGGCFNSEIVTKLVPVVRLLDRRFIVSASRDYDSHDYNVAVPYQFGETLKKNIVSVTCPCCKNTETKTINPKRDSIVSKSQIIYECDLGLFYENKIYKNIEVFNKYHAWPIVSIEPVHYSLDAYVMKEWNKGNIKFIDNYETANIHHCIPFLHTFCK